MKIFSVVILPRVKARENQQGYDFFIVLTESHGVGKLSYTPLALRPA